MQSENNMGCNMVGMLDIKGQDQCRRVYSVDGIAPTLTTSGGGQRQVKIFDTSRLRVRKLTPKEYGILQAFPMDEWEQVVSDSQAYKQFGNAVTTTVFSAIAKEIAKSILESEEREELTMENEFKGMNQPTEEEEIKTDAAVETPEDVAEEIKKEETPTSQEEPANMEAYEVAKHVMDCMYSNGIIARACFTTENTQILEAYIKEHMDGVIIGKEPRQARDWVAAEKILDDILSRYDPSGYMGKAIFPVITPLKIRLQNGERTADLYNEIVAATR